MGKKPTYEELQQRVKELELEAEMRKRTEEALRQSEEKYRALIEGIEEGVYKVDLAGNFTFLSDPMVKLGGYSRDEIIGTNYREYSDDETVKKVYEVFNKVYSTGIPVKGFEWGIIKKDGRKGYVEASISLIKGPEGKPIGFRGVVRDVTEKRKAEEEKARLEAQLQEAQKMEAIATLAAGIAHQFNNALMIITGHVGLLEMDFAENETVMEYTGEMKASAHRMARLTHQLLAYARGGKYTPRRLSVSDSVEDTLRTLRHTIDPGIRVETDLPLDIWDVKADPTQIQMVLAAIVANANEAIEGRGRIRITTRNMAVDEEFARNDPALTPGPYVSLAIQDDGKGMDKETKSRIFEPFFSTHFLGRGLGMAAVYGIVRNHDGWISVDSEVGKGTVVRIYLPAVEAEEEIGEGVVSGPEVDLPGGEGTILVIEDEAPLLEMSRRILERLGYRVLAAKTAKEAIKTARTFEGQIDLALLDIKLPDMTGDRVYPLIMEARPGLKVIVCSGYAIDGPAQEILDAGAEGFIQKPFVVSKLAEKLTDVLGEK